MFPQTDSKYRSQTANAWEGGGDLDVGDGDFLASGNGAQGTEYDPAAPEGLHRIGSAAVVDEGA